MNDKLNKIVESRHDSPFDILGPQRDQDGVVIRTFIPYAVTVHVRVLKPFYKRLEMIRTHPDGLFEVRLTGVRNVESMEYRLQVTDENQRHYECRDAYSFALPRVKTGELRCFLQGKYSELSAHFGAHPQRRERCAGVRFAVWAPNAQRISVVGSFNRWDGRCHPMQKISTSGIWELFIPHVKPGDFYKYELKANNGSIFLKTDPYAFLIEDSPEAAAIVYDFERSHHWRDQDWQKGQEAGRSPAIFKLDTTEQALHQITEPQLAEIRKRGYSHIEISGFYHMDNDLAVFFSPHPRLGSPGQVQAMIDRCHRHGLGVIVAGIPLEMAVSPKNLVCFDGAPLYEQQKKPASAEFCFATDKPGVRSLFLAYLRFWRDHYHIDGFRFDHASHMLYRDCQDAAVDLGILWLLHEQEVANPLPKEKLKCLFGQRRLVDPFAVLGPQKHPLKNAAAIRAILPCARQAYVYFPDQPGVWYVMEQACAEGLWQTTIPPERVGKPYRLHTVDEAGRVSESLDPYAFVTTFVGEQHKKLFAEGIHYRIYENLGAHHRTYSGIEGVNFTVWAPNAEAVSVRGDFNRWNGTGHPLRLHPDAGIWELFVPGVGNGARYQFEIYPAGTGASFVKSDPYAFFMETAPATESVVYRLDGIYQWHDEQWLQQRREANVWRNPISIYEVHLGSWMRGQDKRLLNYAEMAEKLVPYVKEMGFTHIEILPIAEYPYEPSWGYQVSNFYASTSRLGKPEQLMAFIDECHQHGIGVLLDWVAGHFPKDAHALARFDGTHLYEHEDPRKGEHKDWGTLIFNYGRHEVSNFLIANALFWLEYYHFDGLRVDAVASMLYLDYSRKHGEWIPNVFGGKENLEAIDFLKHTNYIVHDRFPGVMMTAEESTAWAGVSRPTDSGGLGFGFKWNMGWMHDVLEYLKTPPEYRCFHHNRLTFVFHYAFEENFILSLSHDEVVHLKGSLYNKMPGSVWEKFANLRLLFFFMYTHPGKKLNFMGAEFAQINEWSEADELQWPLLEQEPNRRLQLFFKRLNRLYRNEPVLYEMDCRAAGFGWIDAHNHEQSIIVFSRKAKDPRIALIVVINFSGISRFDFRIGVPYPVSYTEVLSTNEVRFGGCGTPNPDITYTMEDVPWHGQEFSIKLDRLPALSAVLLKPAPPQAG